MGETLSGTTLVERRGIIGLDLLRFMAALLVVVYHLGYWSWAPPVEAASIRRLIPDAPAFPELEPVAWLGWVGVEIFFVISGFVIANSAERSSPFKFFRSRILRLTPAIWVCATITLAALVVVKGANVHSLTLWGHTMALPLFPQAPWVDSVYWTLVIEFVFYALIFCLLTVDQFAHIGLIAMLLGLMSSAAWFANALLGAGEWFLTSWTAQLLLIRHGCFFAAGVLTWLVLFKRATALRLLVLAICLAAGTLEVRALADHKAEVLGRHLPAIAAQAFFLAGFASIVLVVIFDRPIKRLVGQAASLFPILGLMTYPLYLVHNVVGVSVLSGLNDHGLGKHWAIFMATAFVLALSWIVCRWAEPWIAAKLRAPLGLIGQAGARSRTLARLFRSTAAVPDKR